MLDQHLLRLLALLLHHLLEGAHQLFFFFFNDTATTEIYTLSLHDALPIALRDAVLGLTIRADCFISSGGVSVGDRKSTRLNSSHVRISYAVFCLKKKK